MEEKRSFLITVEGQYYGVHDLTGVALVKQYTAKFVLPSLEAALSTICKFLLDPYLRKHYSDYARFRSHKITSISSDGRLPDKSVLQMPFEEMGIKDLSDFCILNQIMIDPYKHKELEKCKTSVKKIYEERLSQKRFERDSGKATVSADVDKLLEMNELPPVSDGMKVNINEQKILALGKRAASAQPIEDAPLPPVEDDGLS